jgi:peptide/nickel transport system permease protein
MLSLGRTLVGRLLLGLVTLLAVSVVIFSAVNLLPGDFATQVLGRSATKETVAAFQHRLGLDQPAPERYVKWIAGIARGDLGNSLSSSEAVPMPVTGLIMSRLGNTLLLAGATAIIAVPLSLLLGMYAALYRGGLFDRAVNALTLATISFPEFFMAYGLMVLLAVKWRYFPTLSNITENMGYGELAWRLALPVATLTLGIVAHMMRMTRSAIVGILSNPYIEMARFKGATPARIIFRHALPNAWAPIANVVAVNLAYLVVGVVVVEAVFVYPGIGQTMVDAVRTRDIPVVQACALIFASTYILLNLIADVIAIGTNPKLLYPR